jgi:CrcB protein
MQLLWICAAGAAGTGARYLVSQWSVERWGALFPYGTVLVNLVGCFVMSMVMQAALTLSWPVATRLVLTTGFLGGFTTYSAFNYETLRLLDQGSGRAAMANIAVTLIGGLASGWLGLLVARTWLGR